MLHVRDMLPAIPEVIEEVVLDIEEVEEPLYERDAATGLLLRTGESVVTRRVRKRKTGELVQTTSMVAIDRVCRDCGAELAPADGPFYYLLCGRLNFPPREATFTPTSRRLPHRTAEGIEWRTVPSEAIYPDCVLECGGWRADAEVTVQ